MTPEQITAIQAQFQVLKLSNEVPSGIWTLVTRAVWREYAFRSHLPTWLANQVPVWNQVPSELKGDSA